MTTAKPETNKPAVGIDITYPTTTRHTAGETNRALTGAPGERSTAPAAHPQSVNISFADLCQLLTHVGFDERIRGSHHIFTKEGVTEILNLQPKAGKAKVYQVKQVRDLLIKYKLTGQDDE